MLVTVTFLDQWRSVGSRVGNGNVFGSIEVSWAPLLVFQGGFMVFHGFLLVSMFFQGGFMVFGWFPWFFKVVSWFLLGFHDFQGGFMVFHGFRLVSMVFEGFQVDFHCH